MNHLKAIASLLLLSGITSALGDELAPVIPRYRVTQVVLASADQQGMTYLAFPSLLRTNPNEALIAIKRGYRHGGDNEAVGEMLRLDTARNAITDRKVVAQDPGLIYQMGEWVRFPNGDIAVYFDVQTLGHDGRNYRA